MKLWILIKREYVERARSKSFVVTTIIGLLVILGLSFMPAIAEKVRQADETRITVLEQTGQVTKYLEEHLQDQLPGGERQYTFQTVQADSEAWAAQKEVLLAKLVAGESAAVLEITPPDAPDSFIWHTKNMNQDGSYSKVEAVLQQMTVQARIEASGLSAGQLTAIFEPITMTRQVEGLRATTKEQQAQNMMLVYFLLFMLYFSLIVYGMYVANGVVEEKSSRVMEMMISTLKPGTMMAAKILGIGAVGLTQYFIWLGAGLGLLSLKGKGLALSGTTFQVAAIEPMYLLYLVLFFILGFLLYAAMYAGAGAMVSRPEDTNQAVSPMTYLIVIAFLVAMYALYNPDNPWVVALSYVPFFTPMILFARIILTDVSPLAIWLGILDLILAIGVLIWLAGKMYRVGVLMYGKVSWRHMFRLIRER